MNLLLRLIAKPILIIIIVLGASVNILQATVSVSAQSSKPPLTSAQASQAIADRTGSAIDNAINSIVALPTTLFPNCAVKQAKTKAETDANSKKLVNCLKDIVNIVFIVAIIWVIIDITSSNLGVVLRSGEGGGEGPVANARRKLEKAIIGLVLIGGISLILNLFASNLLNISFTPLSALPNIQSPVVTVTTGLPNQAAYYNNQTNGTQRTDIALVDQDVTGLIDYSTVSRWVDLYFQQKGVTSPVPGSSWVFRSRGGTTNTTSRSPVPLQQMIAVAKVESNWGAGTTGKFACAAAKNNMFQVPYSQTEARQDTALQGKIKAGNAQACDYKKTYTNVVESMDGFTAYYRNVLSSKSNCDRWESYSKESGYCASIKKESSAFLDFIQQQIGSEKPSIAKP